MGVKRNLRTRVIERLDGMSTHIDNLASELTEIADIYLERYPEIAIPLINASQGLTLVTEVIRKTRKEI